MRTNRPAIAAFTLVEISIVIVIISLIAGGIVAGRSMVHSAELRKVITEADAYTGAINQFRRQYNSLPGDMLTARATAYWSTSSGGDSDGLVAGGERFRAWEHLYLAGFIERSYTGLQGAAGASDFVISTNTTPGNTPEGAIATTGYAFYYANVAASVTTYSANMGNMITYGADLAGTNNGPPINGALDPADAFWLDSKADDGMPGTGKWIANLQGGGNFGTATACTNAAGGTDYTGAYNRSLKNLGCSFFINTGN